MRAINGYQDNISILPISNSMGNSLSCQQEK